MIFSPASIFITGASSGIGAALALEYAAPGVRLTLHGRSAERLAAVAGKARPKGADVVIVTGDVADASAMQQAIEEADRTKPLDLVIANAGIARGSNRDVANAEQTKELFATNWEGALNTIHPAIALMSQRKRGQIAIVSSLAGFRGLAGASAYGASKAALRIYGEGLRGELAPLGIKVNVICPGFIKTPMTDVNPFPMPFMMSAEKAAHIIRRGLDRNQAQIAFPWPMKAVVAIAAAMPVDLVIRLTRRMPRKPDV